MESKPHSELLAAKDWNVTKVVVFFRSEDDRQRYVDFEPGALTDLFEQLEAAETRERVLREAWKGNVDDLAARYGAINRELRDVLTRATLGDVTIAEMNDVLGVPNPASRPPAEATPFEQPRMQQVGKVSNQDTSRDET